MAHALVEIVCVLSICRLDVNWALWTLYFSGRALFLIKTLKIFNKHSLIQ